MRRFLGTDPAKRDATSTPRLIVTMLATLATAIQIIVWLLIAVVTTHLDTPWWLWTPLGAAVINAALLAAAYTSRQLRIDTTEVTR